MSDESVAHQTSLTCKNGPFFSITSESEFWHKPWLSGALLDLLFRKIFCSCFCLDGNVLWHCHHSELLLAF